MGRELVRVESLIKGRLSKFLNFHDLSSLRLGRLDFKFGHGLTKAFLLFLLLLRLILVVDFSEGLPLRNGNRLLLNWNESRLLLRTLLNKRCLGSDLFLLKALGHDYVIFLIDNPSCLSDRLLLNSWLGRSRVVVPPLGKSGPGWRLVFIVIEVVSEIIDSSFLARFLIDHAAAGDVG